MDTCKGVGSIYRGMLYLFIYYLLLSYHRAEASIQANYSSFYNKLKSYTTQSNYCKSSVANISSWLPLVANVSSWLPSGANVSSWLPSVANVSSGAVMSIMLITSCNVICNSG